MHTREGTVYQGDALYMAGALTWPLYKEGVHGEPPRVDQALTQSRRPALVSGTPGSTTDPNPTPAISTAHMRDQQVKTIRIRGFRSGAAQSIITSHTNKA